MLPQWLRLAIYVAAAVACVWLILRWWQSRRLTRHRSVPVRPDKPVIPPPVPVASAEALAAAKPTPVTETAAAAQTKPDLSDNVLFADPAPIAPPAGLTILKSGVSLESTPSPEPVTAATPASNPVEWQPSPWADRPLLSVAQDTSGALPHLRAEDVPLTREDDYVFGSATPTLAAFLPEAPQRFEESRKELQAAGYYQPHALQNFAAIRYVGIMLGLVVAGVALILAPPNLEWIAIACLIALPLLGWAIPRLYIRGQAAERRSEIERGMPDLLDMLNMCVSQGLTIPDALRRILPDLRGPYPALAQELRIVMQQSSIWTMQTALENFGKRIDIPEVHSFSSLLTQTERMGTSISEALSSYSDTMRESLRQRADEKGNRATFRLLFPTVLCLMPAVYLFLLGPAIVELSNFFSSGGRGALDQGSAVIQRINEQRGLPGPFDNAN
ncbi:hypothetical protein GC163_04890 [bacterium]|nr:hypothetical protein [bacterium]